MTDYYTVVKDNAAERSELTKRQDADILLWNLDKYVMEDISGTRFDGVVHVTLNRPKVVAEYIMAALGMMVEQIVVTSEVKGYDTDLIEDFRRKAFEAADDLLLHQNLRSMDPYFDEQNCIRGESAARCLFQEINGILVPDIMYWDSRYVNYEPGKHGIAWASYGYGTKVKKAVIESEDWWEKVKIKPSIEKEAEVVDVWDAEHNEIWLAGKLVYEQEHEFKDADGKRYTPVVIRTVPLGSDLKSGTDGINGINGIKNRGESVFYMIRAIIPEDNRIISIMQTHNLLSIQRPIQTAFDEGAGHEAPDYSITNPGASSSSEKGGETRPIDLGDISATSAREALFMIDKALADGGLSLDIFNAPLGSGVAIIQAKEGRDVIFQPRVRNKAEMKKALGDMFTAQVIQIGGTVEIGTAGHKRKFQTGELKGEYGVEHEFKIDSLTEKAGLASLAAAYGNSMSEHTKRREIYKMDDPDGEERWLSYEDAVRTSPMLNLAKKVEDLIALEKYDEARLLTDEAGVNLKQLLAGNLPGQPSAPINEPKQMVSLFGGDVGRSGRQSIPTVG